MRVRITLEFEVDDEGYAWAIADDVAAMTHGTISDVQKPSEWWTTIERPAEPVEEPKVFGGPYAVTESRPEDPVVKAEASGDGPNC